jgi:hypothetical protein
VLDWATGARDRAAFFALATMPFQLNQRVRSTKTGRLGTIKHRHDDERFMVLWDGHFMPELIHASELVLA